MGTSSLVCATAVARWWVHFYTLGLPSAERDATRAEVDSDLWEEERHARHAEIRPIETAQQILGRLVLSIPTDVAWRLSAGGAERQVARAGFSILKMGGSATYRSLEGTGVWLLTLVGVVGLVVWVTVTRGAGGEMTQPVRYHHTATLLEDGRVLVTGGQTVLTYGPPPSGLPSAEIYDPSTGHWSATGPMGAPHRFHGAVLLEDGRVLVSGALTDAFRGDVCCAGMEYVFSLASAEVYDPSNGTWSSVGEMAEARGRDTPAQFENGTVLAIGGLPARSRLPPGSMIEERQQPTRTVMGDGRILVTGGSGGGDRAALASAEIYDPATDTWSPAGEMTSPRELHTATLLKDGRVLVAGGSSSKITEIYDPATRSWSMAASMSERRRAQTATLLSDGRVLIVGGTSGTNGKPLPKNPAEVYDPATDTWTPSTKAAQ